MNKLRERQDQYIFAEKIVNLGGRATLLEALLGINKRAASMLFKAIALQSSRGGLLPYDPNWIVKTPINCLHSSYFYSIFHNIEMGSPKEADKKILFVGAYAIYKTIFDSRIFPIERAWHVYLQITCGNYKFTQCTRCQCQYLTVKSYPVLYQNCPVCDVDIDSHKRRRWTQRRRMISPIKPSDAGTLLKRV
ncbi:FlhC family transcriptional regulator [Methylovulum psychrotolerans]|uniref:Flagellar transcriptional regulator FlhC n=1 Tax=Methylovulum psychrotolerans TaxID=1704499 RepID=A0A2S5CIM0_9GAMM|nr:FlhC family transcriptional regulator [Methylovulum psychrotolerans]POZ50639.1 Flagellar transcriptional regulator FlhC [Methylovulum psychrotolerans]